MATMKAVKWFAKKDRVEIIQTKIPELEGPENVLVRVKFAGVCGTDLHIMSREFLPSK